MRLLISCLVFILCWSFISFAQVVAPPVVSASPAVVAAVVTAPVQGGVMGWITSHGGFQLAVLGLVSAFLATLSGVRQILYIFDGVKPGEDIPADKSALTWLNKVCLFLGKVVDIITANLPH